MKTLAHNSVVNDEQLNYTKWNMSKPFRMSKWVTLKFKHGYK